jgi:hypothetical protein
MISTRISTTKTPVEQVDDRGLHRTAAGHVAEEVDDPEHQYDDGQPGEQHAHDDRHEVLGVLEHPDSAGDTARMLFLLSYLGHAGSLPAVR